MKNVFKQAALVSILFCGAIIAKADSMTPAGYWDQYSDNNQLQSIVQIWQAGNGEYQGRVVKGFPVNGQPPNHYCTKCTGDFKDKRIVDLTFIWGLKPSSDDPTKWEGGHILDPESGHIYKLNAKLQNNNQQLVVRAYLGITLLGRTQTWTRISEMQMKQQLAEIKKVIGDR